MTEPLTANLPGGARLLSGDAIIAFRVLDEARCRGAARLFGVPKDESLLVAMIAIGAFTWAVHGCATRALTRARPSVAGGAFGAAMLRETLQGVAGGPSTKAPFVAPLIAFAVLATSFRPLLGGSFRGAKAQSARVRAVLGSRYGG
jgi:hypothetical protein